MARHPSATVSVVLTEVVTEEALALRATITTIAQHRRAERLALRATVRALAPTAVPTPIAPLAAAAPAPTVPLALLAPAAVPAVAEAVAVAPLAVAHALEAVVVALADKRYVTPNLNPL